MSNDLDPDLGPHWLQRFNQQMTKVIAIKERVILLQFQMFTKEGESTGTV